MGLASGRGKRRLLRHLCIPVFRVVELGARHSSTSRCSSPGLSLLAPAGCTATSHATTSLHPRLTSVSSPASAPGQGTTLSPLLFNSSRQMTSWASDHAANPHVNNQAAGYRRGRCRAHPPWEPKNLFLLGLLPQIRHRLMSRRVPCYCTSCTYREQTYRETYRETYRVPVYVWTNGQTYRETYQIVKHSVKSVPVQVRTKTKTYRETYLTNISCHVPVQVRAPTQTYRETHGKHFAGIIFHSWRPVPVQNPTNAQTICENCQAP